MTSTQIKGGIMYLTGMKIDQFSKARGLPFTVVYRVINGTSKNERVRSAISEAIGKPVSEIWPESQPHKGEENEAN